MKAKFLEIDKESCFGLAQDEETNKILITLKNQLACNKRFENKAEALNFINSKKIPWELILNLIVMIVKEILENLPKKEDKEQKEKGEENE